MSKSVYFKKTTIFCVYALNNKASKYKKQNCKEIDESTVTTGDFNTPFSEIAFQVVLRAQNLLDNVEDTRDMGLIPGLGGSPGEGNGNPFQYSCLENPMDRGAWQAIYCPWGYQGVGHDLETKQHGGHERATV